MNFPDYVWERMDDLGQATTAAKAIDPDFFPMRLILEAGDDPHKAPASVRVEYVALHEALNRARAENPNPFLSK